MFILFECRLIDMGTCVRHINVPDLAIQANFHLQSVAVWWQEEEKRHNRNDICL